MIHLKSFKVSDYEEANKFLSEQPIKGEMKLHEGYLLVFYEVDDPENKMNRIQYLRGMLEAHFKRTWEYEEQMRQAVKMRDFFDKNDKNQQKAWIEGNENLKKAVKMLEVEIFSTSSTLDMLSELGIIIEPAKINFPNIDDLPLETVDTLAKKMNGK